MLEEVPVEEQKRRKTAQAAIVRFENAVITRERYEDNWTTKRINEAQSEYYDARRQLLALLTEGA